MDKKLQVFVSSTFSDLKSERQAAVAAILKAGHLPAGMELFTAGDKSQWDTIKTWISESDIYMLIVGGRYGSIEESSNLSYTELEYEYARSLGKPNFAVVITQAGIDKKVKEIGVDAIETTNGKQLSQFRDKVLSHMSSFFDDEKDIKLAVHETLAGFAKNPDLVGWVRGNSIVDTKPMIDEMSNLSKENADLRRRIEEQDRRLKAQAGGGDFDNLIATLAATTIVLPTHMISTGDRTKTLLGVFRAFGGRFITGITNDMEMSDVENFLFFSAGPQLHVQGLVDYEKVPGARYQRCKITKLGSSLMAELARRAIAAKQEKKAAAIDKNEKSADTGMAEGTTNPSTKDVDSSAKKPARKRKAPTKS